MEGELKPQLLYFGRSEREKLTWLAERMCMGVGKRIGEDISVKLDTRWACLFCIRDERVCSDRRMLIQAPASAHLIEKACNRRVSCARSDQRSSLDTSRLNADEPPVQLLAL